MACTANAFFKKAPNDFSTDIHMYITTKQQNK